MTDDEIPLPPETGGGFFSDSLADNSATQVNTTSGTKADAGEYRVLARKYRPRTFDDLIGQESLVRILRRAFSIGRVAHAFMLTGVRGVGKTTTARIIARALNCTGEDGNGGPTADPCGVCPNCKAILADRHPDVLEMDAASRTGVDDVREIIEASRFRPMQARMKVFVIDEVHMLSRNAFNALLKTLEEPPAQVTFIFATTELRKVPVTVLSRCQRFDLQRVPQDMLAAHFASIAQKEGATLEDGALSLIARAADGSVRDGLSLLDQAIAQGAADTASVADMLGLADRGMVFDLLEAALRGQVAQVLEIAGKAYARGADLGVLLADIMDVLHLLSRIKALPQLREGHELPEIERVRGGEISEHISMAVLGRAWQLLLKGLPEVDMAPNRQQAAEMVLIRLCHASMLPTPDKLIRQLQAAPTSGEGGGEASTGGALPFAPSPGGSRGFQNFTAPNGGGGSSSSPSSSDGTPQARRMGEVSQALSSGGRETINRGGVVLECVPQSELLSSEEVHAQIAQRKQEAATSDTTSSALRLVTEDGERVDDIQAIAESSPQKTGQNEAAAAEAIVPPMPRSWREVVALAKQQREVRLHGVLRLAGHVVVFDPPRLVVRIDDTPANQRRAYKELSAMLERLYPGQWQVEPSTEQGEPSLDEQGAELVAANQARVRENPLVKAILQRFPRAEIGEVTDHSLDDYGLPPEEITPLGEDVPPDWEFAPIDADSIEEDDLD